MASVALAPRVSFVSVVDEARTRQRLLTHYGLLLLALVVPTMMLGIVDHRTLDGVGVWLKPAKFLLSVGIFALTTAWFFGYVQPDRRRSRAMRGLVGVLVASGTAELAYIALQAARGLPSHFNRSSVTYEVLYGLMGVAALALVGTAAVLAWEIARRPAKGMDREYVVAVVLGLVLCVALGGGLGMYMAQQAGHSVGATGGRVPLFGWNRSGGDLRIAHFLGIHAQQAIPILAWFAGAFAARWRLAVVLGGSAAYVAVTIATFLGAIHAQPLVPLGL